MSKITKISLRQTTISPRKDFLELAGSIKTNIKATSRQIRQAFSEDLARSSVR